ncbi:MAG: response regulator [Burkholderiales bacterium]
MLAEDNPVNQTVCRAMLERLGACVQVVGDGEEAVRAFEAGGMDLILMDCQMPRMDGYQATGVIREREKAAGAGRRVAIVALTAHAMQGDREKCLAAGMDDYLSKPFKQAELAAVVARWTGGRSAAAGPHLDAGVLAGLRELGGGAEGEALVASLAGLFLEDAPKQLRAARAAAAAGDAAGLRAAVHTLKSSAANMGALRLSELAAALERDARDAMPPQPLTRLAEMEAEFEAVRPELERLRAR